MSPSVRTEDEWGKPLSEDARVDARTRNEARVVLAAARSAATNWTPFLLDVPDDGSLTFGKDLMLSGIWHVLDQWYFGVGPRRQKMLYDLLPEIVGHLADKSPWQTVVGPLSQTQTGSLFRKRWLWHLLGHTLLKDQYLPDPNIPGRFDDYCRTCRPPLQPDHVLELCIQREVPSGQDRPYRLSYRPAGWDDHSQVMIQWTFFDEEELN